MTSLVTDLDPSPGALHAWPMVPLGELGRWGSGGTPKRGSAGYYHGDIPWLKISDLTDGEVVESEESITPLALQNSSAKLLQPGALLIAMYGSIGKLGLNKIACATNQAIAFCYPNERVSLKYLFWALKAFRSQLISEGKGGTQQNISQGVLKDFKIPIPPRDHQDQIVKWIETTLDALDTPNNRLAMIPALLKKFRQSVLAAACSGQLTADWREGYISSESAESLLERIRQIRNSKPLPALPAAEEEIPRDWALTRVGRLCAVATGATPLRTRSAYFGGEIPWITSSAVNDGTVTRATQFITELAVKETNAKVFPPGTLIVAMYGEGQTRGRVAELGIATATNQALAAILFNDVNENCRAFVKLHFLKNYEEMRNLAAGGVQPNLSLGLIRDSELLLPPLDEQAEIVRRVESFFALADSIESRLTEATAQVERTTQAILAKAFRGELT